MFRPHLLIAEYVSEGRSTITNKPYQNSYIGLWRFRDGKICGVKEYLNPMIANEAIRPPVVENENEIDRLRSGDIFEDLINAWKRLGRLVYNDDATDPRSLKEPAPLYMTRYLTAGATLAMELNDPEYPYSTVGPIVHIRGVLILPMDCIRLPVSALGGDSTHCIFGNRGTAHQFDIEIHSPHFANAPNYQRTGNLGFSDIKTGRDGSVEIILSPDPPEGDERSNWIQLTQMQDRFA